MTIDEAIKTLDILDNGDTAEIEDTWHDAVKLGIKALKGITALRCGAISDITQPLPGETKD